MINKRVQQARDLRVSTTFELITGEPPRNTGHEVGDLNPRFPTGVDELDIGESASRVACGEGHGDVGDALRCECRLFVMYDGEALSSYAPPVDSAAESWK